MAIQSEWENYNFFLCVPRKMNLWFFFLSSLLAAVSVAQLNFPHRFTAYCNYVCNAPTCPDPTTFLIQPCNETQTGDSAGNGRSWSQGAFPTLNSDGTVRVNGGVPQAANLTLHLELLRSGIDNFMPDVNYSGNAVLDFEDWVPAWEQNYLLEDWHSIRYPLYSMKLVQQEHPDWNWLQVEQEARVQFEAAGLQFFVETLKTLRSLRPKARWGFYGFPQGLFGLCLPSNGSWGCGYQNPIFGEGWKLQNDFLKPMWAASSAIYPSVYLDPQVFASFANWQEMLKLFVSDTVKEAIRCAETYAAPDVPVMPFYWAFYHNATTTLLPEDVAMVIQQSYIPPRSTSIVMWGGGADNISTFLRKTEGPIFMEAVQAADQCAKVFCNDQGWCPQAFSTNATTCVCDSAFTGNNCSQKL